MERKRMPGRAGKAINPSGQPTRFSSLRYCATRLVDTPAEAGSAGFARAMPGTVAASVLRYPGWCSKYYKIFDKYFLRLVRKATGLTALSRFMDNLVSRLETRSNHRLLHAN